MARLAVSQHRMDVLRAKRSRHGARLLAESARRARSEQRRVAAQGGALDGGARLPRARPARRCGAHATRARRREHEGRRRGRLRLRGARRDRARARRSLGRRALGVEGLCAAARGRVARGYRTDAAQASCRARRRSGADAVTPAKRRAIFERLREGNPNPTTELEHATPFELLVAVVLSAQSTDKGVNKVTKTLFPVANTPAAIAALGVETLSRYIGSLGLFRNKAKNVVALSERLVAEHGGQVPSTREALERLPGVGRKTANVVLNVAFGQPTIAVDTHIFRVANRTGLANGRDVVEVEQQLEATVPDEYRMNAHHWLILHGRYVCVARTPRCPECVIRELCEYPAKTGEVLAAAPTADSAARGKPSTTRVLRTTRKIEPLRTARGVQPMAKTARAGARKGRSR